MGKNKFALRGKNSGLCPTGLMVILFRRLPAKDKIHSSVASVSRAKQAVNVCRSFQHSKQKLFHASVW
jgi:hypothetical protein